MELHYDCYDFSFNDNRCSYLLYHRSSGVSFELYGYLLRRMSNTAARRRTNRVNSIPSTVPGTFSKMDATTFGISGQLRKQHPTAKSTTPRIYEGHSFGGGVVSQLQQRQAFEKFPLLLDRTFSSLQEAAAVVAINVVELGIKRRNSAPQPTDYAKNFNPYPPGLPAALFHPARVNKTEEWGRPRESMQLTVEPFGPFCYCDSSCPIHRFFQRGPGFRWKAFRWASAASPWSSMGRKTSFLNRRYRLPKRTTTITPTTKRTERQITEINKSIAHNRIPLPSHRATGSEDSKDLYIVLYSYLFICLLFIISYHVKLGSIRRDQSFRSFHFLFPDFYPQCRVALIAPSTEGRAIDFFLLSLFACSFVCLFSLALYYFIAVRLKVVCGVSSRRAQTASFTLYCSSLAFLLRRWPYPLDIFSPCRRYAVLLRQASFYFPVFWVWVGPEMDTLVTQAPPGEDITPPPFQKEGFDTEEYADGSRYEGHFHNGERSGHGMYTYADGSTYTGDYLLDKKHGHGKEVHKRNGDVYEGEFFMGKRNGYGVFHSIEHQRRYEGQWVDDVPQGEGKVTFLKTGERYEGHFERGVRCGMGRCWYRDGGSYVGEWQGGLPDGDGVAIYGNGDRFEGVFDKGKRTKLGIYLPAILRREMEAERQRCNDCIRKAEVECSASRSLPVEAPTLPAPAPPRAAVPKPSAVPKLPRLEAEEVVEKQFG
eukprot:gene10833-7504_t